MPRLLRLSLAIAILGALFYYFGDLDSFGQALANVSLLGLLGVLIVTSANRLLMAFKWSRLLGIHTRRPSIILVTQVYCSAMLLGLVLPSTIGADAARTVVFNRLGFAFEHLLSSIMIERVFGLASTLALAAVGLLLLPASVVSISLESAAIMALAAMVLIAGTLALVAIMPSWGWFARLMQRPLFARIGKLAKLIWHSLSRYRSHPLLLTEFTALTLIEQLLAGLMLWLIAVDLGVDVSFLAIFFCSMIAYTLSRIPLTPAGIGVFEGAFGLTLATYGVSVSDALLIALLGRLVQIVTWTGWWLSFTLRTDVSMTSIRPTAS